MDNTKASDIYKTKINDLFPDIKVENKDAIVDVFGDVIDEVFIDFFNSTYIQYIDSKPKNKNIIEYLARIPGGVDNFELWLKVYLEKMSAQFTIEFQKLTPPNISLIYFSQFLDHQDIKVFFKKVSFPKDMKNSFEKGMNELFSEKTLTNFILAMACSCIGLSNSANSLNYLWIQSALFEDEDFHEVFNEAKKLEAVSKKASEAGKKGRAKRYEALDQIKAFAFNKKESRCFPNPHQAAIQLCDDICDFAESIGSPFTDRFTAKDRIYDWFRKK